VTSDAAPKAASRAPRDDLMRTKVSILGGMPLRCDTGKARRQGVGHGYTTVGAERATFERRRVGPLVNGGLPFVVGPFGAFPPRAVLRVRRDARGKHVAVLRRVPLGCDLGEPGLEGRRRHHEMTRAHGASVPVESAQDGGTPDVVQGAFPPRLLERPREDVMGRERAVLRRVPLCDQVGRACGEGVRARDPLGAAAAVWASPVSDAVGDAGLPFVVLIVRAPPPHAPVAARRHVRRREGPVFGRVPLPSHSGRARGERIRHRHARAVAKGAALAEDPFDHTLLPGVIRSLRAFPPYGSIRAINDRVGRDTAVLCRVPFLEEEGSDHGEAIGDAHPLARAERAPRAIVGAAEGARLPFVVRPFGAFPPGVPRRAGGHVAWPERSVHCRVPLARDGGEARHGQAGDAAATVGRRCACQRGLRRLGSSFLPGRHRADCMASSAALQSLFALPPSRPALSGRGPRRGAALTRSAVRAGALATVSGMASIRAES